MLGAAGHAYFTYTISQQMNRRLDIILQSYEHGDVVLQRVNDLYVHIDEYAKVCKLVPRAPAPPPHRFERRR